MAASITVSPFRFDFVNNPLKFTLTGTPVAVAGTKAMSRYKIITMPRINNTLSVIYGNKKFVFAVRNTSAAKSNPNEIYLSTNALDNKNELIKKIAQNYYIEKDYIVTISNALDIIFSARQNGGENVTLQSSDSLANIPLYTHTAGVATEEKKGYRLFAKLEVTRNGTKFQTPEILLHVDNAFKASLPLTMLRSYFQNVDTPGLNQKFAAYFLKYAMIKCRLVYSDFFDDMVQMQKYSTDYHIANGKVLGEQWALNLPDWNCPLGESAKFKEFARPRSYGSASGLTVKSYKEMPQYAYFMLFNTAEAGNYTTTMQFRVDILNENGSTKSNINPGTLTFSNYSIFRVPLSVDALSLGTHSTQIVSYTVRVYHSAAPAAVWTRKFVLQQKPFFAKEFLLQNKYGVLESFFVENEMIEKTIDGEEITCNGRAEIDVQDISTTFLARTGNKSDFELKLLADALESKHNYKIVNNVLHPITIIPGTLTVLDENEDLQEAEFQYIFKMPDDSLTVNEGKVNIKEEISIEEKWNEVYYKNWNDNLTFEESKNTSLTLES